MPGNVLLARAADPGDAGFGQSWHLVGVPAGGRRRRHSWPGPGRRSLIQSGRSYRGRGCRIARASSSRKCCALACRVSIMRGQFSRRSTPVTAADGPAVRPARGWSLSVSKPGPSAAAAQARDVALSCPAAVIHNSTGPAVHSFAGADQGLYLKYPQACAQGVILAGQALQVSMSRGRKPVISRQPSSRTGEEVTFLRIAC